MDALSGRQSDPGDDCASVILTCLFCRFSELLLMLPPLCEAALSHRFSASAQQPPATNDDIGCGLEFDCSALEVCLEAGECLELAMEISEICYR
ncbi:myoD family inhibitor domain-containing protein 2 [Brienomyrus brachyistius]|uniref:myoD family inhibitor domain-containing protein 2 n=1 Tax=Brienomyrus brachyistius TaxID=42636 RepID=UPI0020B226DF|nr:myoD family inhibitor domain-containing protein 2 [Brienomyrus brachyistius]